MSNLAEEVNHIIMAARDGLVALPFFRSPPLLRYC